MTEVRGAYVTQPGEREYRIALEARVQALEQWRETAERIIAAQQDEIERLRKRNPPKGL